MSFFRRNNNNSPQIPAPAASSRNDDAQYEANRAALLGGGGGGGGGGGYQRGPSVSPRPGPPGRLPSDGANSGYGNYGGGGGGGGAPARGGYGDDDYGYPASDAQPNKLRRPPPGGAMGIGGPASTRQASYGSADSGSGSAAAGAGGFGAGGGNRYVGPGGRNAAARDAYARGERNLDDDRAKLFAGASAGRTAGAGGGGGRFATGPPGGQLDDDEEDVEAIKTKTKALKQESVNSTRNALRMAREAEETGRNTLQRLGDQSDQMLNAERNVDRARGHVHRADDNTTEIKALNRSIFIPAITLNKSKKRAEQEAKYASRYEAEKAEQDRILAERQETHQRVGAASTAGLRGFNRDGPPGDDDEGIGGRYGGGRYMTEQQQAQRKQQRSRYQFEATASDDEVENELDDNLNEIGDAVSRLKALALATGEEVERQNKTLDRFGRKVDKTNMNMNVATDRMNRIK